MKIKNHNYLALEDYFKNIVRDNKEIPFITKSSIETGISAATITRYAKCKGYYGYPDMRSDMMKKISKSANGEKAFSSEAIKLIDFLNNNEKIIIYTSISAKPIGYFLMDRLKTIKSDVYMLEDITLFSTLDYAAIAITISGESARIEKFLNNKKKFKDTLLITCSENMKPYNSIILDEYMYVSRTNTELFKALRQTNE